MVPPQGGVREAGDCGVFGWIGPPPGTTSAAHWGPCPQCGPPAILNALRDGVDSGTLIEKSGFVCFSQTNPPLLV